MLQSDGIKTKRTFFCTPIGFAIPIVFIGFALWWAWFVLRPDTNFVPAEIKGTSISTKKAMLIGGVVYCVVWAVPFFLAYMRRVELHSDRIVCKGWLPCHTYELEYHKCNVGMDYSWANGRKVWWIYLCYGPPPRYSSKSLDRISTEKYRPGFIKMHYREDFYNALLEVLPERQRRGLTSAQKFMK